MQCGVAAPVAGGLWRGVGSGLQDSSRHSSLTSFLRGVKTNAIGCNSLEGAGHGKKAIACRRPDLRLKPLPCYKYGFCREPDAPMRMSCPPKVKKRGRGPCCHEADDKRKGGCKVKK